MLSRILMFITVLLTVQLFFFPMWSIELIAPQYPDGIRMYIWINQITGDTPSTLQNINILNHYIGMKFIEPDSIPELSYFPYVIIGIALLALLTIFLNNWKIYLFWLILVIILATLGIYDFYLWEYDYGHNLSATAPIKLPGVTYQPPLLGSKMLLNFEAISLPSIGGILFAVGLVLASVSIFISKRNSRHEI